MKVKRKNGDKGIGYLVNDGKLDLQNLIGKNVIVIGERHQNTDDENLVLKLCKLFKPDIVLVESLGDLDLPNLRTKKEILKQDVKEFYYQDFTHHWIKLSIRAGDIPFKGMEYVDWGKDGVEFKDLSYKESFAIREAHFLNLIQKHSKVGKVLAICGDTHLRSIVTDVLGPVSPIYQTYINDPKAAVIRTAVGEIE